MLAEIFLIKMEAILRASKESAPADNSRFVPITLVDKEGLLDKAARPDPEKSYRRILVTRRGSWRGWSALTRFLDDGDSFYPMMLQSDTSAASR